MAIKVYYKGELKATVIDDKLVFINKTSDLSDYLENAIVSIGQEEDEWGNVILAKVENSLEKELIHLKELGFDIVEESQKKITLKEVDVEPGQDMINEAEDYEQFLRVKFADWERKIFAFLDDTIKDDVQKDYVQKSFGDFLQQLFNSVHTVGFKEGIVAVIKRHLKNGLHEAEDELNIDIGFGLGFDKEADVLADRQLEGFIIDGKRWAGIKGIAKEVQDEVSLIVRDGIVDKKSLTFIKNQIKDKLDQYTGVGDNDGRATKIARTEINRFHNSSKLRAYKESGLDGYKVWDSFLDERTSPFCKELSGQKRELDEFFTTEKGGQWLQPPSHPNCRSVIRFELE